MMVSCEETVGLSNLFFNGSHIKKPLDGTHVDEPGTSTGPWPRYLIITSSDEGKTLNTLSPFANHKGVNGIAGGDVTIKRHFNGEFFLTCVLLGNIAPVILTPHRSLNSSKGVIKNWELARPTLTILKKLFRVLLMYNVSLLKGIIWRLKQIPLF